MIRANLTHSCWQLCVLLTGALLLGACNDDESTEALGTLERDLIRLSATSSQIISEIYVEEGAEVGAGTPLLQLDNTTATAEAARVEASVRQAQAYLQLLVKGARDEELAAAQARVDNAKAKAQQTIRTYNRAHTLIQQKLLGQAELDSAIAQRDVASAALKDAQEQLALLINGTRSEEIEQAQAQLQETEQMLAVAQKNLADLHIVATRDGRIDSLPWHQGERVQTGAVVVVMLASGNPYVRTYMPESIRAGLHIGQQFTVHVDGVTQTFTGKLIHIQQEPAFTPHYALTETERSRLMYLAKVQLGDEARNLPSGVPAQVELPISNDVNNE